MGGLADTARLLSTLELQDKFSGPAKAAQGALGNLDRGTSLVKRGFGLLGQAGTAVGGAFNTLKGRIGQLLSGPLGLLGLGAGIGGVIALIKGGIDDVREFGGEVGRLSKVTGLSTETTSALAGVFHRFGIDADTVLTIAGMVEKNLFKLGGTAKAAAKFQDKYGLALVDSNGKLKDFNTFLRDSADFWNNKQIPAAQKAAALAAVYGKSWQTFLPVFSAGSKGISEIEEAAAKLGLTLTKGNLVSIGKLKDATRDWGQALGGLKLQLGLAIVPLLTNLTKGATAFLVTADQFGRTGMQRIVGFFKGLIEFGKKAFGVIQTQVVPIVKKVIDGWNNLPAPLKSLLVKGAAGNFAIKFLLGFSPVDVALSVAGAVGAKVAGLVAGSLGGFVLDFFGRTAANKLIPQNIVATQPIPVFVTNPGFGLPGPGAGPGVPGLLPWGLGTAAFVTAGVVIAGSFLQTLGEDFLASHNPFDPGNQIPETGGFNDKSMLDLWGENTTALEDNTAALKVNLPGPGGHHPKGWVAPAVGALGGLLGLGFPPKLPNTAMATGTGGATKLPDTALAPLTAPLRTTARAADKLPPILSRSEQSLRIVHQRLSELRAGVNGVTAAVRAKKLVSNVKVVVNTSTSISVDSIQRKLTSARVATGTISEF